MEGISNLPYNRTRLWHRGVLPFAYLVLSILTTMIITSCTPDVSVGAEPPGIRTNRLIYRDVNGRELTERDLADATGKVNWFIKGEEVSPIARDLHARGRLAGSNGNHQEALELFSQASKVAPNWPYPLYDAAYTYLLMGNSDKALAHYEAVVKMSPRGFFTSLIAVDSLRREKTGQIPGGTYKQFLMLEWVNDPAEKKKQLQAMVQKMPQFAPAWQTLAMQAENDEEQIQAIEKGLAQKTDAETKGFLLINKALILSRAGKREEARRILGDLALDPKSPLDIEQIAKATLAQVTEN
jgi:tetratricopeptide (TPR) repeat protein